MAKNLVLVESPSKAKTINKYLGRNYFVEATVGHIRNLPKTKLGVDVDNNFEPQLLNIRGKGDLIKKLKSLAGKSEKIFIATDPDREGEAIAQDIVDVINGNGKAKIYRVLFNEITKNSVSKAMKAPIEINSNLVESQRARRVMDRIIGYKISPLLWTAVVEESASSLSAGRVQSVALRLIVEREEEIERFIPTEYWSLWADFSTEKNDSIKAKLYEIDGRMIKLQPKPEMTDEDWKEFNKKYIAVNNEEDAKRIQEKVLAKNNYHISDINKKETRRNPYPPFITSTMQAEASRKLRFRPRQTMKVAQSLYEGVELGKNEGITGLITYMRTDSTRLSEEIVSDARNFIKDKYGDKYVPKAPKQYLGKKKNVQDAHEAIRPTNVNYTPDSVKEFLNKDQLKLYELIWKRFVACQMESAILETTTVSISADEFLFRASGTAIKFDGFLSLYDEGKDDANGDDDEAGIFPIGLEKDNKLKLDELEKKQHFTKPPPRFSESTLIKELESNGIGRPSTYAMVVSTLHDRVYIKSIESRIAPSQLGRKVNEVLVKNFPKIIEVDFTAKMEDELDSIANGDAGYLQVVKDFYIPFEKNLKEVEDSIEKVKCEKCGSDMEIKIGRFGKFLACTGYPDCKNIKSLKDVQQENQEPEFTGEECPKCGGKTLYRRGKFGKFIGCENYPDCDYTKQITLGIACPKCKEGEIVSRRSKRGKFFYGCSRYPDCDYISWTKPAAESEAAEQ